MRSLRALVPAGRTAAVACVVALVVSACGGSDDAGTSDALDGGTDTAGTDVAGAPEAGADTDTGSATVEAEPPEFVLVGPVEPPAGWVLDPANCVDDDESGPPYFDYYVPADWVRRGAGGSGSGGVTMNGDHDYELPDATDVSIEVETDSYVGGEPAGSDGAPWETWDYELTIYDDAGERTEEITHDQLDPVEIDGESFDVFLLDQAQSDQLSASEYKLRVVFAEVPTGGVAGNDRRPESATVTISWNAEKGELTEEMVREVLSTFRVAQCAQEGLTEMYETLTGSEFSI